MPSLVKRAVKLLNGVLRRPRTASAFVAGPLLAVVLSGCVGGVSYPNRAGYDYDNAPPYPAPSQPYYYEQGWGWPGGYYGGSNEKEQRRWIRQRQNEINALILQNNMERVARSRSGRGPAPPPGPIMVPPSVQKNGAPSVRPMGRMP